MLPFSHDEVVHGKGSLIGKMPGDRWQQFANLRAYFAFMWTHPGKKLLFMGSEIAQEREWNHDGEIDWALIEHPDHAQMQALVRALNRLYASEPALHQRDCRPGGLPLDRRRRCRQQRVRLCPLWRGRGGADRGAAQHDARSRTDYAIGLPRAGRWKEILNSDAADFGGGNIGNGGWVEASGESAHGLPASARVTIPPLGAVLLRYDGGVR